MTAAGESVGGNREPLDAAKCAFKGILYLIASKQSELLMDAAPHEGAAIMVNDVAICPRESSCNECDIVSFA